MSVDQKKTLEQRLDDLGIALAGELPVVDEGGAFISEVRRRSRRNSFVRIGRGVGGVGIAAVLLLAVLIGLPRGGDEGSTRPPLGPPDAARPVAGSTAAPTIGTLNLTAFEHRDADGLPVLPSGAGGGGGWGERSLTPGAMYSREVTDALLDAM
jgi:hypothetical protein